MGLKARPTKTAPKMIRSSAASTRPKSQVADLTTPVRELMTQSVVTVTPETSIEQVTELLLDRNISGVPVVDDEGELIGVVSKTDLVREQLMAGDTEEHQKRPARVFGSGDNLEPGYHVDEIARTTVGEIMMPLVFSVEETTTVAQAAVLMTTESVHRVAVLSAGGGVAGVLTCMDVVNWISDQVGGALPRARN